MDTSPLILCRQTFTFVLESLLLIYSDSDSFNNEPDLLLKAAILIYNFSIITQNTRKNQAPIQSMYLKVVYLQMLIRSSCPLHPVSAIIVPLPHLDSAVPRLLVTLILYLLFRLYCISFTLNYRNLIYH